jgi:hypothetical protein
MTSTMRTDDFIFENSVRYAEARDEVGSPVTATGAASE